MARNWPQWLQELDEKIKNAQGDEVIKIVQRLNLRQVPRQHVLAVGNLMRRLNLSLHLLRLLAPWVQNPNEKLQASDDEKALYAMALSRLGLYELSQEVFQSIPRLSTASLFYKASALISQWDYNKAQVIYKNLLKKKDLSRRDELIAKINLASCLIHLGFHQESLPYLTEFESEIKTFTLLYGNSLELKAQALIGLKKFDEAIASAKKSLEILNPGDSDYSLYAKKWELIAASLKTGRLVSNWVQLQQSATTNGDLETLRDLDYYASRINGDKELFLKVYFGTPFENYRQWAKRNFPTIEIPTHFHLNPNLVSTLDLRTGTFSNHPDHILFTPLQLRLLRSLARDFYRAIPVGELFSELYPGQIFDAYTSPHRLFQTVQNLRRHLRHKKIPLEIQMKDNAFRLTTDSMQMVVQLKYLDKKKTRITDEFYEWIRTQERPFSRQDLQTQLHLSRPQAVMWLKFAVKEKWLQRSGAGNHFRYRRRLN